MAATTACADCHRKSIDSLAANKFRPYSTLHLSGGANVNFNTVKTYVGTKATATPSGAQNLTLTCSNVVCHGQAAPIWGGSKAGSTVTQFGATSVRTCTKCHGDAASSYTNYSSAVIAPGGNGTDTSMTNKLPTDPRVGAHQRHLATNMVSAPVKCGECHVVLSGANDAAAMRSANHWNYSTATITFGYLAKSNSHTSAVSGKPAGTITQCSNVYCHSGVSNTGTTMAPFWNMTGIVSEGGNTVAACVKCHAMPPQVAGGTHVSNGVAPMNNISSISTVYNRCNRCHYNVSSSATTVSNVFTDKKLHVNGAVEVQMACNSCHSYLPTDAWTSNYGGNSQGVGAHVKHINYLLARNPGTTLNATTDTFGGTAFKVVCGVCHTNDIAQHTTGTSSNPRQIIFGSASTARQFGGLHAKYNGDSATSSSVNPKSCSNTDCHYKTSPIWSTY
jgi:predicted CxxxxCH...CXXCH cytochrome family protein